MQPDFGLFADEGCRRQLLASSRFALQQLVLTGELQPDGPPVPHQVASLRPGLFVTLKIGDQLRGCIGHMVGQLNLAQALPQLTRAAAFEDPRFPPVRPDELPAIRLELSVLTPPQTVNAWQEIQIGRHGIILAWQGHQAVFLPQVPGEQGWDLPATLTALARKAGLSERAWQNPDCRFQVFEAIHFAEQP